MAEENQTQEEGLAVNRREFLNFAWLASLGFLTVSFAGVTLLFAMPIFKEGEFGGVVTIGPASELPEKDSGPQNYPKVKFWLANSAEGVTALYKVCTHLGCLYSWRDQEFKFVCPCHGSQFEKDGDYIQGPAPRSLDQFVVQAVDPQTGEVVAQSENGKPLQILQDSNLIVQVDTGSRIKGERHS
jgi:cytochrome b6-f complex iron-sulfur subunit